MQGFLFVCKGHKSAKSKKNNVYVHYKAISFFYFSFFCLTMQPFITNLQLCYTEK